MIIITTTIIMITVTGVVVYIRDMTKPSILLTIDRHIGKKK